MITRRTPGNPCCGYGGGGGETCALTICVVGCSLNRGGTDGPVSGATIVVKSSITASMLGSGTTGSDGCVTIDVPYESGGTYVAEVQATDFEDGGGNVGCVAPGTTNEIILGAIPAQWCACNADAWPAAAAVVLGDHPNFGTHANQTYAMFRVMSGGNVVYTTGNLGANGTTLGTWAVLSARFGIQVCSQTIFAITYQRSILADPDPGNPLWLGNGTNPDAATWVEPRPPDFYVTATRTGGSFATVTL